MKTPLRKDDEIVRLENALGSRTAMRILRLLCLYPNDEFSTYSIVVLARVSKASARARLPLLVDSGLVKRVGKGIVAYKFNEGSKVGRALRIFLAETGLAQ